ncbi:hypothetical protein DFQ27_007967 [Actinomortierella ambigua]|uniref:Protein kinase domain-containing protein n=1 Tax=Actinomortierella ambigua TaxID=1343610 RepID=A0A9P6UBQ6_9FUNG|nr:hypothetical protein DFQ27_007967 [Actinomortierella ambigua]
MNSENTTQAVLEIGKLIGAGAYGAVFKGRYNTRKAAIKKFWLHQHTEDQAKLIKQEIGMLRHLQYRHIIQFYGVHHQDKEISLVMDFAEGGSLRQAIEDSRVAGWHVKSRIAQEVAYGLTYIHHEGILHRDLKSDNVLLSIHMEVKLCDFGLAVVKTSCDGHTTEATRGTIRWLAPELAISERPRYSNKSDMYAFGMVMWEMAAMYTVPFRTIRSNYVVAQAVHGGRREQLPEKTPTIYQHWVDLCWKQDPSDRPNAREVIIVDDASSGLDVTNTAGTLWCTLTDNTHKNSMISHDSCLATSTPAGAKTVRPRGEFISLSRKAMLNDVDAQVSLAEMYEDGVGGVPKVSEKAFTWYLRAAQLGHLVAMDRIGDMYAEGQGVEQSDVEAVKWYTRAARQGNPGGQYNLGWMYLDGRGVEQNDVEAAQWFIKAARQGDSDAQSNLGSMYLDGRGVKQSDVEAVKWFTEASNQGDSNAQSNLGCLYEVGGGVKQDDTIAVEWYKKSSAQGNAYGLGNLASMYELGFGVEASDEHALDFFLRANDKGHPSAHFHVQWLTSPDRQTRCSDSDAVEVNRVGAEKGYVAARHNLGRLYERGRGVRMDKDGALVWYKKAAEQGHLDSQQRMEFLRRQ